MARALRIGVRIYQPFQTLAHPCRQMASMRYPDGEFENPDKAADVKSDAKHEAKRPGEERVVSGKSAGNKIVPSAKLVEEVGTKIGSSVGETVSKAVAGRAGAAAGAAVGAVAGPVGSIVGAALGGTVSEALTQGVSFAWRSVLGSSEAPTLQQARLQLAVACRGIVHYGMYRYPDCSFTFALDDNAEVLAAPFGVDWSNMKSRDLLKFNLHGELLEGSGMLDQTPLRMHMKIHEMRQDARCVLSVQPPHANALSALGTAGRLRMIHQSMIRFHDRLIYDDKAMDLSLLTDTEHDVMHVANLFRKSHGRVMFRHRRGVILVGPSVADTFADLYHLELACRCQLLAMQAGNSLLDIPESTCIGLAAISPEREDYDIYSESHLAMLQETLAVE